MKKDLFGKALQSRFGMEGKRSKMRRTVLAAVMAVVMGLVMSSTSLADEGVKCEPGDENYIRAAYLAVGCYYEPGTPITIENFARQDCSQDEFYQQVKAALLQSINSDTFCEYLSLPVTTYIDSEQTSIAYNNIVDNLAIDLMKSGVVANVDFGLVPDDGYGHINYGYTVRVWAAVNYAEIDAEDIAGHPEIEGYYTEKCTTAYYEKLGYAVY